MAIKQIDPLVFIETFWPDVRLYDKQREVIYSVWNNDETYCPAGNQLGKDYVSGLIALVFFLTRPQARVVTSSVDEGQLGKVLWGEIHNFIQTSKYALPLKVGHMEIGKLINGELDPKSYIIGRVARVDEGLLGHHLPKWHDYLPTTLMIYDEASGVRDEFKPKTDTWAHRTLVIGNPFPCTNFFFQASKKGDIPDPYKEGRYYVRVVKIKASDSPNVRWAEAEIAQGLPPSHKVLLPGVKSYADYRKHRQIWDNIRQCISLDAEFYEGAELLLYPPDWLNRAEEIARKQKNMPRKARAMGVDPGEGAANTCWSIVDEYGLIRLISMKTPNTTIIADKTIALIKEYGLSAENVGFDRGGGGKEHADRLRSKGYDVRTIAFGEPATSVDRLQRLKYVTIDDKRHDLEGRYTFKNRRAEMYGLLRQAIDPDLGGSFGIPEEYSELRRQMSMMPLMYDAEGRIMLPPKNKTSVDSKVLTITEMLGCSPDETDSLVLANFVMISPQTGMIAGAF